MATVSWERNEGVTTDTPEPSQKRGELYTFDGISGNSNYLLSMGRNEHLLSYEQKGLRQIGGSFNNGSQGYIKPHFTEVDFKDQIRAISDHWAETNIDECIEAKESNPKIKSKQMPRVIAKRFTLSFTEEELAHFKTPQQKAYWSERLAEEVLQNLAGLDRRYQLQPHLEKANQPHCHCQFMTVDMKGYNYSVHRDGERLNDIMEKLERKYKYILDPVTGKPVLDGQGKKIPFLLQQSGGFKAKSEIKKFTSLTGKQFDVVDRLVDQMIEQGGVANYLMFKTRLELKGYSITKPEMIQPKNKRLPAKPMSYITRKDGIGNLPLSVFSGKRLGYLMKIVEAENFESRTGIKISKVNDDIKALTDKITTTTSITAFANTLARKGIEFKPVIKNNRVTGGSFIVQEQSIKMSWLSEELHWKNLKSKFDYSADDVEEYRQIIKQQIKRDLVSSDFQSAGIGGDSYSIEQMLKNVFKNSGRGFLGMNGKVEGNTVVNKKTGQLIFEVGDDGGLKSTSSSLAIAKAKIDFLASNGRKEIEIVSGDEIYKSNIWLACQLSQKEINVSNYSPTDKDLEKLESSLVKLRAKKEILNDHNIKVAVEKMSNPTFRKITLCYCRVDEFGKFNNYIKSIGGDICLFSNYSTEEQIEDYNKVISHCEKHSPQLLDKVERHYDRLHKRGEFSNEALRDKVANKDSVKTVNALIGMDLEPLKNSAPEVYSKAQAFIRHIKKAREDSDYGLQRARVYIDKSSLFDQFRQGKPLTGDMLVTLHNKVIGDMKKTKATSKQFQNWMNTSPIVELLKHKGATAEDIQQIINDEFKVVQGHKNRNR